VLLPLELSAHFEGKTRLAYLHSFMAMSILSGEGVGWGGKKNGWYKNMTDEEEFESPTFQ
jgi:hypothetical protein